MNMGAAQIRNCVPDRGVTSGPSRVNPVHRHAGARAGKNSASALQPSNMGAAADSRPMPRDASAESGSEGGGLERPALPVGQVSALQCRPTAGANPPNSQREEDRYAAVTGKARVVRMEPIPPGVAPDDGDAPARRRGRTSLVGGQPTTKRPSGPGAESRGEA